MPHRGDLHLPRPELPEELENLPSTAEGEWRRLSESKVWQAQRGFFHHQGVGAWSKGTVPHYITTNPALARAYAQVVIGYWRDWLRHAMEGGEEPFYILELGAGSGRFGYMFLKALLELRQRSPLASLPFCYVLSDFTESNLQFWQSHGSLQPFVEQGVLDFALFDAEKDGEVRLRRAGRTLEPARLSRPLVAIANYVFDSIPHDAFAVKDGQLHECLFSHGDAALDGTNPEWFQEVLPAFRSRPIGPAYYPEPGFNALLARYASRLGNSTFLFEVAALRCLDRLRRLASDRLLLLSADKGYVDEESLQSLGEPHLEGHGSFSLAVNYHAIGAHVAASGGRALFGEHPRSSINICAFLHGAPLGGYVECELAFHENVVRAGPDDSYAVRRGVEAHYESMTTGQLLSLIRLTRDDPRVVRDCLPALMTKVEEADASLKKEVATVVRRAWDNHYPIGEERDLAFELGLLMVCAGLHEEALFYFNASLALSGAEPATLWNVGMCHLALGRFDEAVARLRRARELDADVIPLNAFLLNKGSRPR
ncbi:tetratricopeptide repeat protein [Archangium lansingense]|uniref:tetratricopeptide repeat protein n=1 Tax=Archangium lansingense TaxID=2995310 RepID=UPI003B7FA0BF